METNEDITPTGPTRRQKSWVATAAVATGLAIGAAGLAGAATGGSGTAATTTDSSTAAATAPAANGTAPDPSTMTHGPGETLLTGDIAAKVEAAALKAVPGATIIRVETDSSGGTYEAHLKKADGSFVTVQFDADVNVTSTDSGFGRGPQGQAPPAGAPASGTSSPTSVSN
jgi:hypothetical protein